MSNQVEISFKWAKNIFYLFFVFTVLSLMVFSCVETNNNFTDPPIHHGDPDMGHNDDDDKESTLGNGSCDGFFGPQRRLLPLEFSGSLSYPLKIIPTGSGHTHNGPTQAIPSATYPSSKVVPVIRENGTLLPSTNVVDVVYQVDNGGLNTVSINKLDPACNAGVEVNLNQNIEALILDDTNLAFDNVQGKYRANFDATIDISNLAFQDHEYDISFYFITDDPAYNHNHCKKISLRRKICYESFDLLFDYPGLVRALDGIIDAKDKEKGQRKFRIESSENGIEIKKFQ